MQAEGTTQPAGDGSGMKSMAPSGAAATESAETLRQRHAQVSRSLFGNLVEPTSS